MCGRYIVIADTSIAGRFAARYGIEEVASRYNAAPSQSMPVVVSDRDGEWHTGPMHWGLVPSWAQDQSFGGMINARAETIAEKPSFRSAFKRRRCLVPASGYYEWVKTDSGKQPYLLLLPDRPVFAFAGIWEQWKSDA